MSPANQGVTTPLTQHDTEVAENNYTENITQNKYDREYNRNRSSID